MEGRGKGKGGGKGEGEGIEEGGKGRRKRKGEGGGQKGKQLLKGGFWCEKYGTGICKVVCNQHGIELA